RRSPASLIAQEQAVLAMLESVSPEVIGPRLGRARRRLGLAIRELASLANVNKNSIVRLEQGGSPQPLTVIKLCAAMNIHVAALSKPDESAATFAVHRRQDDRWYDLTAFGDGPIAPGPMSEARRRSIA